MVAVSEMARNLTHLRLHDDHAAFSEDTTTFRQRISSMQYALRMLHCDEKALDGLPKGSRSQTENINSKHGGSVPAGKKNRSDTETRFRLELSSAQRLTAAGRPKCYRLDVPLRSGSGKWAFFVSFVRRFPSSENFTMERNSIWWNASDRQGKALYFFGDHPVDRTDRLLDTIAKTGLSSLDAKGEM